VSFYVLISNYVGSNAVFGGHLHHGGGDVTGAYQGEGGLEDTSTTVVGMLPGPIKVKEVFPKCDSVEHLFTRVCSSFKEVEFLSDCSTGISRSVFLHCT